MGGRHATYLKHLLDSIRFDRTILADVATIDLVSTIRRGFILSSLIVSKLLEDGLGDVCVQVVDKDVLTHLAITNSNCYQN